MEEIMKKTYVVSADIQTLLKKWAEKKNFTLPSKEFFAQFRLNLVDYLSQIFSNFDLLDEKVISKSLSKLIRSKNLPTISLDPVYFNSKFNLEISRLIDENGNDYGLGRRQNSPLLIQQFRKLKLNNISKVILVDDVIFSGSMLTRVIEMLHNFNIKVALVCAGIGVNKGIKHIKEKNIEVKCVYTYNDVIDEICERDFYPGVPLSGRLVFGQENLRAPYILPFGDPGKWASIPKNKVEELSRFCIKQSITLFSEIESCSNKEVLYRDIDYRLVNINESSDKFTDILINLL
jgi:hypothetical protein